MRTAGKKEYKKRGAKKFDKIDMTAQDTGSYWGGKTVWRGTIPTKKAMHFRTFQGDEQQWRENPLGSRYSPEGWMNFLRDVHKRGIKKRVEFEVTTKASARFGGKKIPLIVDGNHRIYAAHVLGIKRVPYIVHQYNAVERVPLYHPRLRPFGPVYPLKRKAKQ